MSFRVSSNIASLATQRHLSKAQRQIEKSLMSISSGSRITKAGDDAAGFAISEGLRGQLSGTRQAKFNSESAISLIQTAEGGLAEQNNILIRMRELAVYSASDTIGDEERAFLNTEFEQLVQELDRIARSTRFGHKSLLTGTGEEFQFQIGAYQGPENTVKFRLDADTTAGRIGIQNLSVLEQDDALDALEDLDGALSKIAGTRATFGAMQSRLQFAVDNLAVQAENIEAARSQIVDADIAEEVSNLAKGQILQEMGVAVLAQANSNSQNLIRLIA